MIHGLTVEESLDTHFRSLLKRCLCYFYCRYLAVCRHLGIYLFYEGLAVFLCVDTCLCHHFRIHIDQCNKSSTAGNHDRFHNIWLVVYHRLNLFRIYILAIRGENHIFAASLYEYVALFVQKSEVSGVHPAILCEGSLCCLLIFIILFFII